MVLLLIVIMLYLLVVVIPGVIMIYVFQMEMLTLVMSLNTQHSEVWLKVSDTIAKSITDLHCSAHRFTCLRAYWVDAYCCFPSLVWVMNRNGENHLGTPWVLQLSILVNIDSEEAVIILLERRAVEKGIGNLLRWKLKRRSFLSNQWIGLPSNCRMMVRVVSSCYVISSDCPHTKPE